MKYPVKPLLLFVCFCFPFLLNAQKIEVSDTTTDINHVDEGFIIAALDSLASLHIFSNNGTNFNQLKQNKYNFTPNYVPYYPDSVYFYRIQQMAIKSPIKFEYNQAVKDYIGVYADKKRAMMPRVMGLCEIYFPMFEQMLDQYNLPLELKYLAIVESALQPAVKSWAGASGLWQFMYHTGKVYNLEVTSYVDDRCDPIKATRAACLHFQDLYKVYGDWLLVLAAYNSGAGNVNKAIRRSGGKRNFWEIRPFLPLETRNYVPAFIAVNYVMNYSQEHNIYPNKPSILYSEIDTVAVVNPLSLSTIAEKVKMSPDELRFLNPSFKTDYIPAYPTQPYFIRIPVKYMGDYLANETDMYAEFKLQKYDEFAKTINEPEYIQKKAYHKVRAGETMSSIANKYDCTASDIKRWNKLKSTKVVKGANLVVYKRVKNPDYAETVAANTSKAQQQETPKTEKLAATKADSNRVAVTTPANEAKSNTGTETASTQTITKRVAPKYYTVKKGDGLGKIAEKNDVTVENLKKWNNLKTTTLAINQKLRVNAPYVDVVVENKKPDADDSKNVKVVYYTVQPKDTLWSISEKYKGVTVSQMVEWNNIEDYSIHPGQKLKVILPAN